MMKGLFDRETQLSGEAVAVRAQQGRRNIKQKFPFFATLFFFGSPLAWLSVAIVNVYSKSSGVHYLGWNFGELRPLTEEQGALRLAPIPNLCTERYCWQPHQIAVADGCLKIFKILYN